MLNQESDGVCCCRLNCCLRPHLEPEKVWKKSHPSVVCPLCLGFVCVCVCVCTCLTTSVSVYVRGNERECEFKAACIIQTRRGVV